MIKKVHEIVRIFNRSPQKNEILQQFIVLEHKKELTLLRDCKTCWNSMLSMIERFLLLLCAISKALVDLSGEMNINEKDLRVSDDEFQMASRKAMIRTAKLLLSCLFQTNTKEDIEVAMY